MKLLVDYPTLHRLRCEDGHETQAYPKKERCPHYSHGSPCNKPVKIERKAKR